MELTKGINQDTSLPAFVRVNHAQAQIGKDGFYYVTLRFFRDNVNDFPDADYSIYHLPLRFFVPEVVQVRTVLEIRLTIMEGLLNLLLETCERLNYSDHTEILMYAADAQSTRNTQARQIIRWYLTEKDKVRLMPLTVNSNVELIVSQITRFQ